MNEKGSGRDGRQYSDVNRSENAVPSLTGIANVRRRGRYANRTLIWGRKDTKVSNHSLKRTRNIRAKQAQSG